MKIVKGLLVLCAVTGVVLMAIGALSLIGSVLPYPTIGNWDAYINDLGNGAIWVGGLCVLIGVAYAIGHSTE